MKNSFEGQKDKIQGTLHGQNLFLSHFNIVKISFFGRKQSQVESDKGKTARECDIFRKNKEQRNTMCTNLLTILQAILSRFQKFQSTKMKRGEHMNAVVTVRQKIIHGKMKLKMSKFECQC